jgi:uncharacterized damage-inducible protein DinB
MQITPEQATFLLHAALPSFENEHRLTTKILKAIPADKADYRPDPNSMSAFDLAWHMVATETRFMRNLPAGEIFMGPLEKPKTMSEIIDVHAANFKADLAAIKAMSGEELAKIIDFRGVFQLPAVAYLNFVASHTIHHRGQMSVYLRPMGAKVPSMYGESYDDAQIRLAAAANN